MGPVFLARRGGAEHDPGRLYYGALGGGDTKAHRQLEVAYHRLAKVAHGAVGPGVGLNVAALPHDPGIGLGQPGGPAVGPGLVRGEVIRDLDRCGKEGKGGAETEQEAVAETKHVWFHRGLPRGGYRWQKAVVFDAVRRPPLVAVRRWRWRLLLLPCERGACSPSRMAAPCAARCRGDR